MKTKRLPFSVNRNDVRPLFTQIVNGIREAIITGYYAPGDKLPSSRELCPILGVSRIVTQAALEQLAAEGFVVSRPRIGTVVRNRNAKQWLGQVVLVGPEGDDNYFQAILSGTLRDRLTESGFLFNQVCVRRTSAGRPDFTHLDAMLSRSVDLVIALYTREDTFRYLARRKVPYVAFWEKPRKPAKAVGFTHLDYNLAVEDFAMECSRLGVQECVEVYWDDLMCDVAPICRKVGIRTHKVKIPVDVSSGRLAAVKQAGFDMFSSFASHGRIRRDAVYFVADDYLASGALLALACAGLSVPGDIRIATWANTGLGPVYPKVLSRMEIDPIAASSLIASASLEYLKTGHYLSGGVVGPKWVAGETMGASINQSESDKEIRNA